MAGCLADKIVLNLEIFVNYILDEMLDFLLCLTKVRDYYSSINAFELIFSCKAYCMVDFGHAKILDAIFRSILTIKYYCT